MADTYKLIVGDELELLEDPESKTMLIRVAPTSTAVRKNALAKNDAVDNVDNGAGLVGYEGATVAEALDTARADIVTAQDRADDAYDLANGFTYPVSNLIDTVDNHYDLITTAQATADGAVSDAAAAQATADAALPASATTDDITEGSTNLFFTAVRAAAAVTVSVIGSLFAGATAKTTPADADVFGIGDSADSGIIKKLTFENLLATIAIRLANIAGGLVGIIYVGTFAGRPAFASGDAGKFVYFTDRPTVKGGWSSVRESTGTPGTYIADRLGGGAIVHDTWSNCNANYDMTVYNGCTFRVTDIGVNGMDFFATGGLLRIKNRSGDGINIKTYDFLMSNAWINFGGGSATYVQAGNTVTVTKTGHGLSADFNGASIFLTGGTGTFTSESCSNFTWLSPDSFSCVSATSRSTNGSLGANTAKTYSPWTYTFPTGLIQKGDAVSTGLVWRRFNSSANNKTLGFEYSGTVLSSLVRTTGANWFSESSSSAIFTSAYNKFLANNAVSSEATDTTRTLAITSTLANAADWDLLMPVSVNYTSRSPI